MASNLCSFTGRFYGEGVTSTSLKIGGQSPLQIELRYAPSDPTELTGTIGNNAWTANITANEELFDARTNPCPVAGNYTLVFHSPNNGDSTEPQGNGIGTASIGTTGHLTFKGTLADGTEIAETTILSTNGAWPLYSSLYGGHGQVLGWLNFAGTTQSDFSGAVSWMKSPGIKLSGPNAKIYPAGFSLAVNVEGSHFVAGTARQPVLDFTEGWLIMDGANVPDGSTNYFSINPHGTVSATNHLSLTLSESTGSFTGTAPNPAGGRPIPFSGIFLSKENYGAGYFIESSLSGSLYLGPQ
jgi:hypothetical protein